MEVDIVEQLQAISARIPKLREHLSTEEATKTSLVLPFIRALGYDFTDPTEVVPEYHADVPGIKAERADYAIMQDGQPIILFECKPVGASLGDPHHSQLFRYFTAKRVRVGVLTNGLLYEFYSDLDDKNVMDRKPFMIVDMQNVDDAPMGELRRFAKGQFAEAEIMGFAAEMKYNRQLRRFLAAQFASPGEDFAKMLTVEVYQGKVITQKVRDQFLPMIQRALQQFISDQVNERLRTALTREPGDAPIAPATVGSSAAPAVESPGEAAAAEDVTTVEEIEAYLIIKSIVRNAVAPSRVVMRDQNTYCGILLDNNNRKPLCRLWFNRAKKAVSLFDVTDETGKAQEQKVAIDMLDDIYGLADRLLATAKRYEGGAQ
ncbi:MAG: type I restriction enzyme HsdR N-terminal domain-containing protein [Ardenticatenales bacterium]|nr:type I restriction enzyme HsdR N-terminal domain-containing protein [Ardenticatenales bacterium]